MSPPERHLDEEVLVRKAREGDAEAFSALARAAGKRAYGAVYRVLGAVEESRDATQEALLRAWRYRASLRPESSFASWLAAIAVRVALDHRRRERTRFGPASHPGEMPEPADSGAGPERLVLAREEQDRVLRALGGLSEITRAVVVLRALEGLSSREVAEALGLSEGAVRVHLHRGRARLGRALGGDGDA